MVTLRQVMIPYYGVSGRERGGRFAAFTQITETKAVFFLRQHVVAAAKHVVLICWNMLRQKLEWM